MKFSPLAVVACILCVGILVLGFGSPQQSRVDADEISQKKSDIQTTERMARDLMETLSNQQTLNQKLSEVDNRTIDVVARLQESITILGQSVHEIGAHVKDSVPTREEVTRLVSTKSESAASDGECTCGEKLSDLQKQIDDLKAKLATLECQCETTTAAKPASAAAAASSYGTITHSAFASSGGSNGGSTGMAKSYGSTGSGFGSTGSAPQSAPRESVASDGPHITVVTTPSCARCPGVYATVQTVYGSAGWLVDKESEDQRPGVSYPYYRVCVGLNCIELHCTPGQLDEQVKSQLVSWGVSFSTDTSTKSRLRGERLASGQPVFPNARWNK